MSYVKPKLLLTGAAGTLAMVLGLLSPLPETKAFTAVQSFLSNDTAMETRVLDWQSMPYATSHVAKSTFQPSDHQFDAKYDLPKGTNQMVFRAQEFAQLTLDAENAVIQATLDNGQFAHIMDLNAYDRSGTAYPVQLSQDAETGDIIATVDAQFPGDFTLASTTITGDGAAIDTASTVVVEEETGPSILQTTLMQRVSPVYEYMSINNRGRVFAHFGYYNPNPKRTNSEALQMIADAGITDDQFTVEEYLDFKKGIVHLQVGSDNRMVGDTTHLNDKLPTKFRSGRKHAKFKVKFAKDLDKGNMVWVLNRKTSTAGNPGSNVDLIDISLASVTPVMPGATTLGDSTEDMVDVTFEWTNKKRWKIIVLPIPPVILPPIFIFDAGGGSFDGIHDAALNSFIYEHDDSSDTVPLIINGSIEDPAALPSSFHGGETQTITIRVPADAVSSLTYFLNGNSATYTPDVVNSNG